MVRLINVAHNSINSDKCFTVVSIHKPSNSFGQKSADSRAQFPPSILVLILKLYCQPI